MPSCTRRSDLGSSGRPGAPAALQPRLGTEHFLLWVACAAVHLAVVRVLADQPPGWLGTLLAVAHAATTGAAWAGLLIFGWLSLRGRRWTAEPGLWLAAVLGASMLLEIPLYLSAGKLIAAPELVSTALLACLLVVPTCSRHLPMSWKVPFYVLVLWYAAGLIAVCSKVWGAGNPGAIDPIAETLARARPLAIILVLSGAAVWSHRQGKRWGWLHWAGIGLWIWMMVQTMVLRWLV